MGQQLGEFSVSRKRFLINAFGVIFYLLLLLLLVVGRVHASDIILVGVIGGFIVAANCGLEFLSELTHQKRVIVYENRLEQLQWGRRREWFWKQFVTLLDEIIITRRLWPNSFRVTHRYHLCGIGTPRVCLDRYANIEQLGSLLKNKTAELWMPHQLEAFNQRQTLHFGDHLSISREDICYNDKSYGWADVQIANIEY